MSQSAANITSALWRRFEEKGAQPFETDILQSASLLLELYGEDIRGRAFTLMDLERGEMVLRPDFTVPTALQYLRDKKCAQGRTNEGWRYCYRGKVFRATDGKKTRCAEEEQLGFEIIDPLCAARAEIEVFSLFYNMFAGRDVDFVIADVSLLRAAIVALKTSSRRKAFLLRHIWRPSRFLDLLARFSSPQSEAAELSPAQGEKSPIIGLRTPGAIAERLAILAEDAKTPPISPAEKARIEALLALKCSASDAFERLRALGLQVNGFSARLEVLKAEGIDLRALKFEGSYGQTSMEYYDGFIFGGFLKGFADAPPIISGGRYDALMRALGDDSCAAIGGVFRNGLFERLKNGEDNA